MIDFSRYDSEYGIPDCHDESAYPSPEELTINQWRWEFVRRRVDYREDYRKYSLNTYNTAIHLFNDVFSYPILRKIFENPELVDDPSIMDDIMSIPDGIWYQYLYAGAMLFGSMFEKFQHTDPYACLLVDYKREDVVSPNGIHFSAAMNGSSEKYGLSRLPNFRNPNPFFLNDFFEEAIDDSIFIDAPEPLNTDSPFRYVKFDLSIPIDDQIKMVRCALLRAQVKTELRDIDPIDFRIRDDKWPIYLRVLDAETQGLSPTDIGRLILKKTAHYNDPGKRAEEHLKAAKLMQINFRWDLASMKSGHPHRLSLQRKRKTSPK